jgi:hypothetical protein
MDTKTYNVIFEGQLSGDKDIADVKRQLAALFKMNATQVEALFTGKPVAIKRGVDADTAKKYAAAFKNAGAICKIAEADNGSDSTSGKPAQSTAPTSTPSKTSTGGTSNALNELPEDRRAGKDIVDIAVPNELPNLTIAQAGEKIPVLKADVAVKIPDTAGLSFSTDEKYLQPTKETPPPKVDIGGLSIKKEE